MTGRAPAPLYRTPVPVADVRRGDGAELVEFAESELVQVNLSVAGAPGDPLRMRPWQRRIHAELLARRPNGRLRHRTGLIGMPRKNGKSGGIGVPLALHRLFLGAGGEEIYSCAAEKEQARIVFGDAAETIRASPNLVDLCKIGKDYIEVLGTGSVYQVLSAEAYSKEGRRPALTVYDELHAAPDRGLWDVMANGRGSSPDAQLVAITTPGVRQDRLGQDTICFEQFQYGVRVVTGELEDPTFYFVWWGAPDSADHRDPRNWRRANPGYGDILDPADIADGARKQPEPDFRTKRLGQWVSGTAGYLPGRAWEKQARPREISRDEPVVLTLDGSFNNDSTGIVVTTLGPTPYQDVVEAWERPPSAGDDWRVPILDVENVLRWAARERYRVVSIAADPARWARSLQLLEAEGLPIVEFPQSPERMTKATVQHYDLVVDGDLTHSGEQRLARHIGNAVLKSDARGSRLAKETRNSRRHIDLAVCSVMGTAEAARMTGQVVDYDVLDSIL